MLSGIQQVFILTQCSVIATSKIYKSEKPNRLPASQVKTIHLHHTSKVTVLIVRAMFLFGVDIIFYSYQQVALQPI
jgi:hypothetical protein